ncbi:MAG: class I SAM-dependent methyltransferase [Bacteroidota bacterium]
MTRLTLVENLLHRLNILPQPIYDAFLQTLLGRAIMASNKLGLFDRLILKPSTSAELASDLKVSTEGVELLLDALEVAGYVRRRGIMFEPTRMTRKWLNRRSDYSIKNLLAYFETLHDRWSYLDETIRRGRPEKTYFELFTPDDWCTYTYGMMDLARLLMPQVLNHIDLPDRAEHIVDIGGSHGLYSIELCRKYPQLHATVVDFPGAAIHGKQIIRETGFSDRISYLEGDFLEVDLGMMCDAVLSFNIVHGLRREQNELLAGKVHRTLRPGGNWYVVDEMRTGKKYSNLSGLVSAMVGLHLFNEVGGRAYSIEEVQEWCESVGFTDVKFWSLQTPGVVLVRSRRV